MYRNGDFVWKEIPWRLVQPVRQIITFLYELCQQTTPLAAKDVGPGEAAVSAAHAQVGDAFLHQVKGSGDPALTGGEGLASGGTYHCPTLRLSKRTKKTPQRCYWQLQFSRTHACSCACSFLRFETHCISENWMQVVWVSDHQTGSQVYSACL